MARRRASPRRHIRRKHSRKGKTVRKTTVGKKRKPRAKKWYRKAIMAKPPYTIGGWSKGQTAKKRRSLALRSRPKGWSLDRKYLSTARALQALANVTTDYETRKAAKADAEYFFGKAR